ncbi:hypothetical protein KPH14_012566 [Odynerus spinipes]|uniref:Retrotransposon gag domain-containing protein n=1 Tax=Odynerus spinipes TaxID=1348599 RepID=A0AAD9RFQ6_9HYME|nr:hypothetical protein KPH14_012566 [Odynerus spinipes]
MTEIERFSEVISGKIDQLCSIMSKLNSRITTLESERNINEPRTSTLPEQRVGPVDNLIDQKVDITEDEEESIPSINSRGVNIRNLREHLHFVHDFDGKSTSVEGFIAEIKAVLTTLSAEEKNLFIKLVRTQKIIGEGRSTLDGCDIRTIEEFIETLRLYFGDGKTLSSSRMDRSKCIQGRDTVLMYNKRFTTAQLDVRRAIINDSSLSTMHKRFSLSDEDRHGLTEYICGLNEYIRIAVRACRPESLKKAQSLALDIEREEKLARSAYDQVNRYSAPQINRNHNMNINHNRGIDKPNSLYRYEILTCKECNKIRKVRVLKLNVSHVEAHSISLTSVRNEIFKQQASIAPHRTM